MNGATYPNEGTVQAEHWRVSPVPLHSRDTEYIGLIIITSRSITFAGAMVVDGNEGTVGNTSTEVLVVTVTSDGKLFAAVSGRANVADTGFAHATSVQLETSTQIFDPGNATLSQSARGIT